jgi:SAM-dependent methyltransferase
MATDEPLHQLEELARAAEAHARLEHGVMLDAGALDGILGAEAAKGDSRRRETLAASYGAWLGELVRKRWGAQWVGLSEPAAPRLRVGGLLVSPIDAVRRRLQDPAAPALQALLDRLEKWIQEQKAGPPSSDAWDRLSEDPRFVGGDDLPRDTAAAREALDEWIRKEGIQGKALLCLGAGGGRHGPLHALAGADVTVVDFSEKQLDRDRAVAAARGLKLQTVRASMDDLRILKDASFDLVLQPVSSCYVADVRRVYAEVARVLRRGGLYVAQHKQPASLQGTSEPSAGGYVLVRPSVDGSRLPPLPGSVVREAGTAEFVHSLDALLGGLCRAGFVIEDVVEPPRADAWAPAGSAGHRAWFLPPYLKIKARRA